MSRNADGETEFLLGNKQLLGIFFIIAVLLGVFFLAGYMLGRGSFNKRAMDAVAPNIPATSAGAQTRSLDPPDAAPAVADQSTTKPEAAPQPVVEKADSGRQEAAGAREDTHPRPKPGNDKGTAQKAGPAFAPLPDLPAPRSNELFTPEPGQRFLQVAAEKRESAEAVADVLTKAGFPAHVAAKPGDDKLFRVLVGPIKDNSDLAARREALTKKGFTGMIQRTF